VANQWATLLALDAEQKRCLLTDADPLSRLTHIKQLLQ